MCIDSNWPFFLKMTFTASNITANATINREEMIISVIFCYLCSAKAGKPFLRLFGCKVTNKEAKSQIYL